MNSSPNRGPVGMLLKRFPRLSETFILNEMRALERLGTQLHVFSLMRPEDTLAHPAVTELKAPVTYFPAAWSAKIWAVAQAHADLTLAVPARYLHALGLALWWSVRSRQPLSVWKQFLRSGYVAVGCRRHHVQHLHAHFANAPATVARLVSVLCNIPYSFTTHAKDLYLTPQQLMRRRVGSASFVLTCTRYNLEHLRSFLPARDWAKLHLVYHGVDLTAFPFQSDAVQDAASTDNANNALPLILSVGRLVPKKGFSDLISACLLLQLRGISFRCLIVGAGPLRGELEAQIDRLCLKDVVTLSGAMAHNRLIELYGRAKVFCLAPHVSENGDRDGIPNVLGEAMAAGVPVVSTSVSGIPELIEDDRTGLLVGPRDPAALADALQRLLGDRVLRQNLAVAARRAIEYGFECWETAKTVQSLLPPGARL